MFPTWLEISEIDIRRNSIQENGNSVPVAINLKIIAMDALELLYYNIPDYISFLKKQRKFEKFESFDLESLEN